MNAMLLYALAKKASPGPSEDKTLLWENPNPTDNYPGQTAQLARSADAFDGLSVVFALNTSAGATQFEAYAVDANAYAAGGVVLLYSCALPAPQTTYQYARTMYVTAESPSEAVFSSAYRLGATTATHSVLIPVKIYGVKRTGG